MRRLLLPTITTVLMAAFATPVSASPRLSVMPPPPPPPAPATTRSAPPACRPPQRCRPYRRYYRARGRYRHRRSYRRYRRPRYRSYRKYRRYRTGRLPYRYRRPYHKSGGPYVGYGTGYLGFIRPAGGYQQLDTLVYLTPYVGWNFSPLFGLELGYSGTLLKQQDGVLGDVRGLGLFNVTLDLKVRLIQPTRLRYVVPYLQAGLGISFLQGTAKAHSECEDEKTLTLAHGGMVSVGGGLDIYLTKWMTLGARGLYRPMFMSGLRCGPGECTVESSPLQPLHAWSVEFNIAITWPG